MSRYCDVKTEFTDRDALVAALLEMGWTEDQIEVHEAAEHLFGYKGDRRNEMAHVIIRRNNVCRGVGRTGSASNDLGFFKTSDGTYRAIISDYDRQIGFNNSWIGKLKGEYAVQQIRSQVRGRTIQRERLPNGRQIVRIQGYR